MRILVLKPTAMAERCRKTTWMKPRGTVFMVSSPSTFTVLIFQLVLSLLAIQLAAAESYRRVYIFNPGFEKGISKWYFKNVSIESDNSSGSQNHFAKLAAGEAYIVSNFPVALTPGKHAKLSFSAKVSDKGGECELKAYLQRRLRNSHKQTGSVVLGKVAARDERKLHSYEISFITPSLSKNEYFKLCIVKAAGKSPAAYLDDIQLFVEKDPAEKGNKSSKQKITRQKTPALNMRELRGRLISTAHGGNVRRLTLNREKVPAFKLMEASFDIDCEWRNPYDPDDINVEAEISLPSGNIISVPAFYYEEYEPANGVTQMTPSMYRGVPSGAKWRVRFAPTEIGEYSLRIHVRAGNGKDFQSQKAFFQCVRSAEPGYVAISKHNRRYFETSGDGAFWWGCGVNIPWTRSTDPGTPKPCYEFYFKRASGNMNATRVWLCHWSWLEWTDTGGHANSWRGYAGLGYYNQMVAAALDRVFRQAERNNLKIMLCLDDNNELFLNKSSDGWSFNPYNKENGGPCEKPDDVFKNNDAMRKYRDRIRYILARWGYSTSLWSLNSWNDMSNPTPEVLRWLDNMRSYVHSVCDNWRPIIYGSNFRYEANSISDYAQPYGHYPKDRPAVLQECYYVSKPIGLFKPVLRQTIWKSLSDGMAAVMVWPHGLVEKTNSWEVFKAPIAFAKSLKLNDGVFEKAIVKVNQARSHSRKPFERLIVAKPYGDIPVWGVKSTVNRFKIDVSRSAQWLVGISPKLYGIKRGEWRNPPTFTVDFPSAGKMLLEILEIGDKTQVLRITLDGKLATSQKITGGRRFTTRDERWMTVDIPAGKHILKVENIGKDWVSIGKYCFTWKVNDAANLIGATGMTGKRSGFLYLMNHTYSLEYKQISGATPVDLQNVSLVVSDVPKGKYKIECVNTATGDTTHACEGKSSGIGGLTIRIPSLASDLAVRWKKKEL